MPDPRPELLISATRLLDAYEGALVDANEYLAFARRNDDVVSIVALSMVIRQLGDGVDVTRAIVEALLH